MEYTGERLIIGEKECDEKSDIYNEHIGRYEFARQFIKDNETLDIKILDIACGAGYGCDMIAKIGVSEVWGGDISDKSIKIAKKKYGGENLHFRVMDVTDIPFEDNYFDTVVSFETIEHIKNHKQFLAEVKRVLKPNGLLILSTPNRRVTKRLGIKNPFHIKEFSKKEIVDLLSEDFKDIKLFGQRPVKKLSLKQKLIQKMYFIYRRLRWLNFLARFASNRFRKEIGKEIEGLGNDFVVREIEEGEECLYLIVTAALK